MSTPYDHLAPWFEIFQQCTYLTQFRSRASSIFKLFNKTYGQEKARFEAICLENIAINNSRTRPLSFFIVFAPPQFHASTEFPQHSFPLHHSHYSEILENTLELTLTFVFPHYCTRSPYFRRRRCTSPPGAC